MIIFGPIPSRRLGKSLGINNIPPKHCTYSCLYCQIGRTVNMTAQRQEFYKPEEIYLKLKKKLKELKNSNIIPDYLTFVPDGEPTLDLNLAKEIELIKEFGIKIAVITNSSLIHIKEVQDALSLADWVSVKVDTVEKEEWLKINRPHRVIDFQKMLNEIIKFSQSFKNTLVSETMVVKGINDSLKSAEKTATYLSKLNLLKSYILVPTRPPAEKYIKRPDEKKLIEIWNVFSSKNLSAEIIAGFEGNSFFAGNNLVEDILSITSVHPIREDAMKDLIKKCSGDENIIEKLISENLMTEIKYNGSKFYLRKFK